MKKIKEVAASGTLDPDFAEHGVLYFPLPEVSGNLPSAVLALPENKLLVVIEPLGQGAPITVARLNEGGALDREFGENKYGFVEVFLSNDPIVYVFGLSHLSDGGWLIIGQYISPPEGGLFIVRQRADGQLEQSFGEGGILYIDYRDIGGAEDTGVTVEPVYRLDENNAEGGRQATGKAAVTAIEQADGKIVLVSNVTTGFMNQKGIVLSLNSDGSTNKDFNGGFVIVELPGIAHESNNGSTVAIQADGKVLVGGNYFDENQDALGAYLMRFDAKGQVDTGFNGGHVVTIPHSGWIDLRSITVRDSDGRIVAVGDARRDGGSNGLIVVLNTGGSFNLVFNDGKPLFSGFVSQGLSWGRSASQRDGSIIVAGSTGNGFVTESLSAITARYRVDGSLDPAFNGKGYAVFNEEHVFEGMHDLTVMADGRVVICGSLYKSAEPWPVVIGGWVLRYLA